MPIIKIGIYCLLSRKLGKRKFFSFGFWWLCVAFTFTAGWWPWLGMGMGPMVEHSIVNLQKEFGILFHILFHTDPLSLSLSVPFFSIGFQFYKKIPFKPPDAQL
jgi:hypothetical protein